MEREPETTSKGINPAKAFAIVTAVLVVVGVTWYLAGSKADPPPTTEVEQPDFSLTDEEAIARFKELDRLRLQAIDSGDPSLLSSIFVRGSDINRTTANNIRRLKRADVTAIHDPYEVTSIRVLSNSEQSVKIEQVVEFDVRFRGPKGQNLTQRGGLERQTIVWSLALQADKWLIEAARILSSKRL